MSDPATEKTYIESVLAAHEIDLGALVRDRSTKVGYMMACACGFRWSPEPPTNTHRAHLAEALAAALRTPPEEAMP